MLLLQKTHLITLPSEIEPMPHGCKDGHHPIQLESGHDLYTAADGQMSE